MTSRISTQQVRYNRRTMSYAQKTNGDGQKRAVKDAGTLGSRRSEKYVTAGKLGQALGASIEESDGREPELVDTTKGTC